MSKQIEEIGLKESIKAAIKQAYDYNKEKTPSRKFTREVYRSLAKALKLDFRSDYSARKEFGSWGNAVASSVDEVKEEQTVITEEVGNIDDSDVPFLTQRTVKPDVTYKILVFPDMHMPYHSEPAVEAAIQLGEAFKPDEMVHLGDLCDFYNVSNFPKKRDRPSNLGKELDEAKAMLAEIKARTGAERCTLLEGNHEARIRKYIWNKAPQFGRIRALHVDSLLGLKDIGWDFIPEHKFYAVNDVYFTHGEFCTIHAAKKHMDEYRVSIIHGHAHRITSRYHKGLSGTIEGHEMGCLCSFDVSADYVKRANWQHAVGTVVIRGSDYWINAHHIRNGVVEYDGRIIDGNK